MDMKTEREERLLSAAEREMVAHTRPPRVSQMSRVELQALGKRLREARGRSRRIASQQQREMRGKADPRGAGVVARRLTAALSKLKKPAFT